MAVETKGRTEELRLPIAGEWTGGSRMDEVVDPFTGDVVARVPLADAEQMDRAIAGAAEAFCESRHWPTYRRADILTGIARGIQDRADDLADTITRESGKPIQFSRGEVARAVVTFTLAADEARRLGGEVIPGDLEPRARDYTVLYRRFPLGPISAIAPFNFPLNLVAHKIAPAIAAGNPVVLKPPMQAPITSLKLAKICYDAGLPPAALSVVHSEPAVAERLATDPRFKLLTFTGSDRVGWHLKSIAGQKRVLLELGGNAATIVHDDADLEWAATRCAAGGFAHAGQVCIKVQRILIQRGVYDAFVDLFLRRVGELPVGDPWNEATVVGPLIDTTAADRVTAWIDEAIAAGAKPLVRGDRRGNIVGPHVLARTRPDMKVESDELFGPGVTVRPYDDFDEALRLANDSAYGLQAGVFTRDAERIWRAYETLDVGGVVANDFPTLRVDNFPYGGVKQSGFGREGPRFAVEDMTELKVLAFRRGL
jgi:acyl-CoA reductase-like NAD-dependent aldehyde dehydrogenase